MVNGCRYLGVHLDFQLTSTHHILKSLFLNRFGRAWRHFVTTPGENSTAYKDSIQIVQLACKWQWKILHVSDVSQRSAACSSKTIHGRRPLDHPNKLLFDNQILHSVLTYAAIVRFDSAKTHIKKLKEFQNRLVCCAAGAPWFVMNQDLRRDLELATFGEHLR